MDISVVLTQMGILVTMMLLGFICAKLGLTGPQFNKSVNAVVMNVLLVCTILSAAMTSRLDMSPAKTLELLGVGVVMFIVSALVGLVTPRLLGIKGDDGGMAFFMVMFMNTVFVAYPVVEALYGQDGILYASVSNIPFNALLYSVGTLSVCGGKGKMSVRKMLSPPLIATVIALIITMTKLRVPAFIAESCTALGRATVPMSMLVIGTSLGGIPLKDALRGWRVYAVSAVRLLVCPVLTWLVLGLFVSDPMTRGVYTILASAPVAMVATILAIQYDKNEAFASQGVFISTVLSAVTMPVIIWLLIL